MLPCIDMVNHSSEPNAYYEEMSSKGVALLLRPDMQLPSGSEVTISYGTSKTEAEMLFSYGFIDEKSATQGMTLILEPFPNDPLGKAKVAAFSGAPTIRIFDKEDGFHWESPFSYFLCLNEEDGLDFKVLQQTDGSRSQLKVFWHGADVTDATENFEALIKGQDLRDVFQLRVVALLQARIQEQLQRLYESEDTVESLPSMTAVVAEHQTNAMKLRKNETAILEKVYEALDTEVSLLTVLSISKFIIDFTSHRKTNFSQATLCFSISAQWKKKNRRRKRPMKRKILADWAKSRASASHI